MLMLFLPAACSGPQSAGGSPAPDASAPQQAIVGDKFTITFLTYPDTDLSGISYLQRLLNEQGWGIRFRTLALPQDANRDSPPEWQSIEADISSGAPSDGYLVRSTAWAKTMLSKGLTQDLARVLPDAAPALYNKYRLAFGESVPGIPLSLQHYPKGGSLALFLQKDIAESAEAPIASITDVLSLLEKDNRVRITARASYSIKLMLDAWAGEQGYYPLSQYGIDGSLY
jgi:hypothetical protein